MVKRSKQDWSIGKWVLVGFMRLKIVGARAEYDGLPDIYTLVSSTGKQYEFIPHHGLRAI